MGAPKGKIMNPKGRGKGSVNRKTRDMREAMSKMLNMASPQMIRWLARVANGYSYKYTLKNGTVMNRKTQPDPAKAFELTLRLAEFVIPKLSRIDMGEGSEVRNTFLVAIQNNLQNIATKSADITEDTDGDEGNSKQSLPG